MELVLLRSRGKCGGSYKGVKRTYSTCGMKHFWKCLVGTENCFGCGKDGHNVRDFPNVAAIGKEAKKYPPRVVEGGSPKRNHFYALGAKGIKSDDNDAAKL